MNKETRRVYEYQKENYEKIQFQVRKGKRDILKKYAEDNDYKNVATYIKYLVNKDSGIEL